MTPGSDDMLQPNPLLHTECEKEREALFLLRWKVITDYIDRGLHKLVRIYSKSQLTESLSFNSNLQGLFQMFHAGVEQKPHAQTKLDNLLVLQSLLLHSNPDLVLFGGKGFIPFVKEEQRGFFLGPCYPPNFKNPEVYSSEILNLNSSVDDCSLKYSPTLQGEMRVQVMSVRSLNFSFQRGIKLGFWKRWHSKISMKKKSHSPMVKESSTNSEVKGKSQSSPATTTSNLFLLLKRVSQQKCDSRFCRLQHVFNVSNRLTRIGSV